MQYNAGTRTDKGQLLGNVCSRYDLRPTEGEKMSRPGIGHNRPPKKSEPFGIHAAWLRFADHVE